MLSFRLEHCFLIFISLFIEFWKQSLKSNFFFSFRTNDSYSTCPFFWQIIIQIKGVKLNEASHFAFRKSTISKMSKNLISVIVLLVGCASAQNGMNVSKMLKDNFSGSVLTQHLCSYYRTIRERVWIWLGSSLLLLN